MTRSTNAAIPSLHEIARVAVVSWRRWVFPAVAISLAAAAYAVVRDDTWEAAQALMVRNEAGTREATPGKFREPAEMKTVQETILEVVRSRGVLEGALAKVGDAPTEKEIAKFRENIKLSPPKGAEFGKTEVFYLQVRDEDRQRAIDLNRALVVQLQDRLKDLRDAKARSMSEELEKTVQLAKNDLAASTASLSAVEAEVGGDLAELKAMGDANSGDSPLRRTTTEIRAELRSLRSAAQSHREQLKLLEEARNNPGILVANAGGLLDAQPALKRLKDGLVDAQIGSARLLSKMSAEHPLAQAARQAEEEVAHRLHQELTVATSGVEADLRLNQARTELLEKQLAEVDSRLGKLAALRASHVNLTAAQRHSLQLTEHAVQNLAEARAGAAGAKAASLVSPIDAPDAGIRPVGPGRIVIALGGIACGLLTGLGVLLLTVSPGTPAEKPSAAAISAGSPSKEPLSRLSLREALERAWVVGKA